MWQNVTGDPVPATWTEACELRKAESAVRSCSEGGTSIALLRQGIKNRWHRDPPEATRNFTALWEALKPKSAAIVAGRLDGLDEHWRRHFPTYGGTHYVEVERRDKKDRVWWDDPLGPPDYKGEWMTKADLERFVTAYKGALHLVAPMK